MVAPKSLCRGTSIPEKHSIRFEGLLTPVCEVSCPRSGRLDVPGQSMGRFIVLRSLAHCGERTKMEGGLVLLCIHTERGSDTMVPLYTTITQFTNRGVR